MRFKILGICWIAFVISFGHNLYANFINFESKRVSLPDRTWQLEGDASGSQINTKTQLLASTAKGNIFVRYLPHTIFWLNSTTFLFSDEDILLNNGMTHLRYNYTHDDFLTWEAFLQLQYNPIQDIEMRAILGTGPRLTVINIKNFTTHWGPLFMHEYQKLSVQDRAYHFERLSMYLSFYLKLNEAVSINQISYYQPNLFDLEDFRMILGISFSWEITKGLTLHINYSYQFENFPPLDRYLDSHSFAPSLNLSLRFKDKPKPNPKPPASQQSEAAQSSQSKDSSSQQKESDKQLEKGQKDAPQK